MPGKPTPQARTALQAISKGHDTYKQDHKKTIRFYLTVKTRGNSEGTHFATIYGSGQELSYEKCLQAADKYVEVMRGIGVMLRHDGYEAR